MCCQQQLNVYISMSKSHSNRLHLAEHSDGAVVMVEIQQLQQLQYFPAALSNKLVHVLPVLWYLAFYNHARHLANFIHVNMPVCCG